MLTQLDPDFTGLPGIKPVLYEKEKFSRTDSQMLIIKGINPLNRPHSSDCTETLNR